MPTTVVPATASTPSPLFTTLFPVRDAETIAADAASFDERVSSFFGGRSSRCTPSPSMPASFPTTPSSFSIPTTVATYSISPLSRVGTRESYVLPPPYYDVDVEWALPTYREPDTLARQLFLHGFYFPLFWILGSIIIFSKLQASPSWEPEKTTDEREKLLALLRIVELKWAKRCLWGLVTLVVGVASIFCIFRFSIFADLGISATDNSSLPVPPLIF